MTTTIGMTVIFHPKVGDEVCRYNGVTKVPAIVTQVFGNTGMVNLQVLTDGQGVVWRTSVPYFNECPKLDDGTDNLKMDWWEELGRWEWIEGSGGSGK